MILGCIFFINKVICLKDKPLWLESGTEQYIKFAKNN